MTSQADCSPQVAQNRGYILVVEDDFDVRETLVEVLSEEGYEVVAFAGGRLAFDYLYAAESLPSLILLDLMMPAMDGWEFRAEQTRSESLSRVACVILSADGNVATNTDALRPESYLRKPIHIATLLQLVERYCGPPMVAGS